MNWRWRDLAWLFATPLYVVIGTLRHELAHAFGALAEGAEVVGLSVLPHGSDGRFVLGRAHIEGPSSWPTGQ